jgi:hypothetical protein
MTNMLCNLLHFSFNLANCFYCKKWVLGAIAIVEYSRMEVGQYKHGFHRWITVNGHKFDSIWVILDRLSKSNHFIPVNTNYRVLKYAEIYIDHVLCLHRVLKMIISDRGSQFVTSFLEQLHASLRTHLIHSSAYHPQKDGQTEHVNQILEDMLRSEFTLG